MADRKTWRDLEAAGVKRCCAIFTSGNRCRRRAVEAFEGSWCAKHGPIIKKATNQAVAALHAQKVSDDADFDADLD